MSCKPIEAATYANRIHVRCEQPIDDRFAFFAAATSDAKFAARALSVIEAAQLGDKFVYILFDPDDLTGAAFGCLNTDCRTIQAVTMSETPLPPPDRCVFDTNRVGCPGYCAAHDDIHCPGFCNRHPTERGCPNFCTAHPTERGCPNFCDTHPSDRDCRDIDPCIRAPHRPDCR